ncbi:MAG TPA: 4'-phosphopantetheinyl transferase superfamily protein [Actinomycetota bacterium]|nr:4'-phosphopantetheinyl transferase superfamily protein [Actinomycetota bacterium]
MTYVDVWRVDLSRWEGDVLTQVERERALTFGSRRYRRRWMAARSAVRVVVSRYVGADPLRLPIVVGPHGKPSTSGICFNVSHSAELALVAVAPVNVGVDVEEVRPERPVARLAARVGAAPDSFYRDWTRKEAYLKATGLGLRVPLREVDVSGDEPAPGWSLLSLDVGAGYAAAVCADAPRFEVALRDADPN